MRDADVIIIGGGIMGCATAWQLAKAGQKVLVIERDDVGAGSAGATDGVVGYHTKQPGPQMDLAVESIAMFTEIQKELGDEIEFDFTAGGLQPAEDMQQYELLKEIAEKQSASGVDVHMISAEEACALEPQLAKDITGALYCPTSGKINPLNLTMAYARAAKALGTVILTNTNVTDILVDGGAVKGVATNHGTYYADKVVNCGGSWAGRISTLAGIELPIRPRKGQLAITEPVGFFMKATVQCARYDIIKFWPERIDDERVVKLGASLSIEQTEDGGMIIGGTRELVGYNRSNTFDAIEVMMKRAIRFFPALENVDVIRFFSGFRPYTPDGLPLLGEVQKLKGYYVAAGHEGDGIALSPVTGRLLTELITEGHTSYNIDTFSPNRFLK